MTKSPNTSASVPRICVIGITVAWVALFARPEWAAANSPSAMDARPNVLLICVDDLRPALGCYGDSLAQTPHIDRLAQDGVVFRRAYCQFPSCCPSRTSFLTGLRIETTRVRSNGSLHFREFLPKHITLPQHFKQSGYDCREFGKVFHRRDPVSWSEPKWIPPTDYAYPIYGHPETRERQRQILVTPKPQDWWGHQRWIKVDSWEAPDVPDEALFDGKLARRVVEILNEQRDRPFFLAVGFFRPHLPFVAPKRYYDLYPVDSLRLPAHDHAPTGSPQAAQHNSSEPRSYTDLPRQGDLTVEQRRQLFQGYYACVSYVDAQVGLLLRSVRQLDSPRETVVVLLSDHGYHLGDHGMWGKNTNFEEAARSTLIVSAPDMVPAVTYGLVELVDIYPTLCELCGLPIPENLQGMSFVELMRNPERRWKSAVFTQASPRGVMGDSIRTERYRYTEWRQDQAADTIELYDYAANERRNLAAEPEHEQLLQTLKTQLHAGWRHALPSDQGSAESRKAAPSSR